MKTLTVGKLTLGVVGRVMSLVIMLSGNALSGCEKSPRHVDPTTAIRGTVYDQSTNTPLDSVRIAVIMLPDTLVVDTTDANGRFSIDSEGLDPIHIVYWRDGCNTGDTSLATSGSSVIEVMLPLGCEFRR